MSPTLVATLSGLVTVFCWGTTDWLSSRSAKKLSFVEINFGVQVASFSLMVILLLIAGIHLNTWDQFLRIVGSNIINSIGYMIFIKALSTGVVGIVVPLGNIYPLFTILLSAIFLGTSFKADKLAAMITIVLGAAILSYEKNHQKVPVREFYKDTALSLLAAVVWGFSFFILNPIVTQVTWQTVSVVGEFGSFVFAALVLLLVRKRQTLGSVKRAVSKTPLIIGTFGVIGGVGIYFGANRSGSVVIPTVLSAAGPLVASAWAAAVDKERLGIIKRLGAVIVVVGVIMLNIVK